MQLKQYKELTEREQSLRNDMKNFIINAVKAHGGRITYTPTDDEGDEVYLGDKYPVVSTLWGKHDTYSIAVSDVYIKEYEPGHVEIYADGIDQDTEFVKKEFRLYPEQFSDVIHFIVAPIRENIYNYAIKLALKELIDRHEKLPSDFKKGYGTIKDEYRDEYNNYLQSHREEIEALMIKCSDPNPDKQSINSDLMGIIGELAELALIEQNQLLMDNMTEDCDEEIRFTEEKQNEFNDLYDEIEEQIWEFMNFNGID